jgi:hypothetical protein
MDIISKLVKNKLVKGLPHIVFKKKNLCDAWQMDKQVKTSFKSKNHISTKKSLELLHIDIFGPTRTKSISCDRYIYICNCSWLYKTWVFFLSLKMKQFMNL